MVPTGVHLVDPRGQLLDAAERVVLRDGAAALSGRAVTAEAGVANGVLHRHFATVDALLAALVDDRLERIASNGSALLESAGTRTVEALVTAALPSLVDDATAAIALAAGAEPAVVAEQLRTLERYLDAECELGRLAPDADTRAIAAALIGATELLITAPEIDPGARLLARIVRATLADAVQNRLL
jgi:AcrR family transcriptional regulator